MKIQVMLPVYNEEKDLRRNTEALHRYLKENLRDDWGIVVVDNASTDGTLKEAMSLAEEHGRIRYLHLGERGRGRALKAAWLTCSADVVGYMDIDLSTDIKSVTDVVEAFHQGYDVVVGTRLTKQSEVVRSLKREILSRGYNLLLKLMLGFRFSDAQCGFKFLTAQAAKALVPQVIDNRWFFDTELLFLAQKSGYKVKEIPVKWVEDQGSTVRIPSTIYDYLSSIFRLRFKKLG